MPQKVKNSGKSGTFLFSQGGKWTLQQIHGWQIWVDAKHQYIQFTPRDVAIAIALRQFWITNKGTQFPWRETLGNLKYFVRRVGTLTRDDYTTGKTIIRELGSLYMDPTGTRFVYASTRGPQAVSGFVQEPIDAVTYEVKNHQILSVMEGRIANGTVEPAGQDFGVPVKQSKIKTKIF